jgi:hypothetical protein
MTTDFKDQIKQIGERVHRLKEMLKTEEATKTAFVMPLLQHLGYDIFNPTEVVPEFITDIGTKKGEKIDYAIFKDDAPAILIECKHWNQNLNLHDGQLLRYFHVSKAKFGILTNGIVYRFYTDLVEPNKMDEKPFLEFNISEIKDNQIDELKKFHKTNFNIESIISAAGELKFTNELTQLIHLELNNPTEAFVRHFAKQVYPSSLTQKALDQFTILTKNSINNYVSDLITDRLKSALNKEKDVIHSTVETPSLEQGLANDEIATTEEELQGYYIVKSILRQKADSARIVYRDAKSYFAILLDNNNRKTICRLHFNGKKKYIGIFNEQKVETKTEIASLDDLFGFSEQLNSTVHALLNTVIKDEA